MVLVDPFKPLSEIVRVPAFPAPAVTALYATTSSSIRAYPEPEVEPS